MSADARDLCQRKVGIMDEKRPKNLAYNCDFHGNCRVLLHAVNLRHGADSITSTSKEGMLRIFSGLNPRTWVPKASMLTTRPLKPLQYWSAYVAAVVM
jgi:hypothetical protein